MASIACFRDAGSDASSSVIHLRRKQVPSCLWRQLGRACSSDHTVCKTALPGCNSAGTQAAVADDSHYVKVRRELLP